jgi:hypothetical protein
MIEIEWEPHDSSKYGYATALVTSLVSTDHLMVVQFKGKSSEAVEYSGVMRLPRSVEESQATGTYRYGGVDATFRLYGAFQDSEFTVYEGTWIEGDYVATVSFDRTA